MLEYCPVDKLKDRNLNGKNKDKLIIIIIIFTPKCHHMSSQASWKFGSTHYLGVRLVLNVPIKNLHAQNYCSTTLIGKTTLRILQHEIGTRIIRKLLCTYFYYSSTNGKFKNSFNRIVFYCRTSLVPELSCGTRNVTSKFTALLTCRQNDFVLAGIERCFRPVFLNRRAAARYRPLASIIPGCEMFSWNLSF